MTQYRWISHTFFKFKLSKTKSRVFKSEIHNIVPFLFVCKTQLMIAEDRTFQ